MKITTKNWKLAVQSVLTAGILLVAATAPAQSGTWTNLMGNGSASGSWSAATNWLNSVIASGADNTADFSTLSFTSLSTNTLDGARTIGNLIFASTSSTPTNWVVNASATNATLPAADAITLAVSSGSPIINVSNQMTTINASIFGLSGFTKTGGGTLFLNDVNTNATGQLNGPIMVNQGILLIGNANPFVQGSQAGASSPTDQTYCTNGGTIQINSAISVNNEVLYLGGAGNGGTNGALYANPSLAASTSTRWGLSISNANSSVAAPSILLTTNATIRVDSTNTIGTFSNLFLIGYVSSSTVGVANITNSFFTLTKTGAGRLELERGMMVSNVDVQAGSVFPDSANAFNAVQQWVVEPGAAIYNDQNNTFNAITISLLIKAGGVYDANFRGNGTPGNDNNAYTQNLGTLTGAGSLTCGERGEIAQQNFNIYGTNNNSFFSGAISDTNGDVLNIGKTGGPTTTFTMSGTNTYHGTTTVTAGTLLVDGLNVGGSNFVVGASGTLGGSGTVLPIAPNVISLTGNLVAGDPANGGGTLTVSNVTGSGNVIVSNASLAVIAQLNNSGSGYLASLYLTNGAITAALQQDGVDASIYTSAFNVDGTNSTLGFTTVNPTIGQFPFIKFNGSTTIGGLNGFAGLQLQIPTGIQAYLSNNTANASIDIVVTAIPALVWQGAPNGNWTIGGSADWLNGATASTYTETAGSGPFVIFNDFAPGTPSVNVSANVTPKGVTVINTNLSYLFSGSGTINCSGSVVKDGPGTLTLANSNAFSGTVTVLNGTLAIGNGGTTGSLGSAGVANSGTVAFNRSDNVTIANSINGSGSLAQNGPDTVTLTGVGSIGGNIAVNAGTLALAPAGTIVVSGNVTGNGAFGINSGGTVDLTGSTVTYSGGSLITGGTLEFDNAFPPSGNIADNGTLAFGTSGTFSDNISGTGGLTLLLGAGVTLSGANSYVGPTTVLAGSVLTVNAANYPPASVLYLGSTNGVADTGSVTFNSGNPTIPGLAAGGNSSSPGDQITFNGSGQTLTINGSVYVGNVGPSGASVYLPVIGSGDSLTINTNGGVFQVGLGATGSGVNPDNVLVDFSQINNLTINLGTGTNGVVNLGTLDGNPGPGTSTTGATVVNQLLLAAVSNSITAGALTIGAGGRQLTPDLFLGQGTNILNVGTLNIGTGGRDGGELAFNPNNSTPGGVTVRGATGGSSRAEYNQGVNITSGTAAGFTTTVDFTGSTVGGPGGSADLLFDAMVIGNEPLRTANGAEFGWANTFNFGQGTLNANSVSLSAGCQASATGASTMNISGGTASLGAVSLTASVAAGTLNISGATVTTANITASGSGLSTLSIANSTWNLAMTNNGNPVTAPVFAQNFSAAGTVNLGVNGTNWLVGAFPLISYTGSIGGDGYNALHLVSLPPGVGGYLSNDVANLAVDLVVTNAPAVVTVNTNPVPIAFSVSGNSLNLAWPPDHLGWRLEAQTNSLSAGLNPATNAWFTVSGSTGVTNEAITINPANRTVFYRLTYP
jgi:autotransporter-associated beta strand protein